ncbi:MAG: twin-arginine protein translocation system subunit TatC [Cycloclasticus sp. symbiont of Bathymodiolus heckerae]|nr:MAG: twin-arginine protein translocation system subunit TatC [Cycloclasticus sp. symbiont of Bathymodiolus heckerae]
MSETDSNDQETSFVSHLVELRARLIHALVGMLAIFLPLAPFANDIYSLIAQPLLMHMPEGTSMVAIEVISPFLTPLKLTLMLSVFISIPWIFYQIWLFVAPGLYSHEQRIALPLVTAATLLFYTGMLFAYFVVMPLIFQFLTSTAPEGVAVMTDISKYLDFILTLFFAFGMAFQVPIATFLLVKTGVSTPQSLAEKRPYIVVGAFVVGMLLTPPDVISQTLLALPMWLLFEVGLLMSKKFVPQTEPKTAE